MLFFIYSLDPHNMKDGIRMLMDRKASDVEIGDFLNVVKHTEVYYSIPNYI